MLAFVSTFKDRNELKNLIFSERSNCCKENLIPSLLSCDVTTPTLFLPVLSPEKYLTGLNCEHMAATLEAPTQPPDNTIQT